MKTTKEFDQLKAVTLVDTDTWEDTYYFFKLWAKGELKRVYVTYCTKGKQFGRAVGWIDAITGELHVHENNTFLKMINIFREKYMEE